jgi:hypothetical protein
MLAGLSDCHAGMIIGGVVGMFVGWFLTRLWDLYKRERKGMKYVDKRCS